MASIQTEQMTLGDSRNTGHLHSVSRPSEEEEIHGCQNKRDAQLDTDVETLPPKALSQHFKEVPTSRTTITPM